MENKAQQPLRGVVAERVLDHVFEAFSKEEWAELLKVPLERAVGDGDVDLIQKLVEAGAGLECGLHKAVQRGSIEIVNKLLENGSPWNSKSGGGNGHALLDLAATSGYAEIVRLLLLKGADKDARNAKTTALYLAASNGHLAAAQLLLAAGAHTGTSSRFGKSALHVAAENGHVEILRALIKHGADVDDIDSRGSTALHVSSDNGTVQSIDVLIEGGANLQAHDTYSRTPIHLAATANSYEAVLALLKHGAKVNPKTLLGKTPLHYSACQAGKQGITQVVDLLLKWGADEEIVNKNGHTPADVIGHGQDDAQDHGRLGEDIECALKLLANAPADRAWRRRGYLVMCRAHPDRVKLDGVRLDQERRSIDTNDVVRKTRSAWMDVLVKVVGFKEEDVFRIIMGYL